jgi:hypothetical protein
MRAELPPQYENCGLTEEEQIGLPLDIRICLMLVAEPILQETLYEGSAFSEIIAAKFGLDISEGSGTGDKEALKEAIIKARHDKLIDLTPQEIEEEIPFVSNGTPKTRIHVHHLIEVGLTNKGAEELARKLDGLKAGE